MWPGTFWTPDSQTLTRTGMGSCPELSWMRCTRHHPPGLPSAALSSPACCTPLAHTLMQQLATCPSHFISMCCSPRRSATLGEGHSCKAGLLIDIIARFHSSILMRCDRLWERLWEGQKRGLLQHGSSAPGLGRQACPLQCVLEVTSHL